MLAQPLEPDPMFRVTAHLPTAAGYVPEALVTTDDRAFAEALYARVHEIAERERLDPALGFSLDREAPERGVAWLELHATRYTPEALAARYA
jgi:methylaspartate ammonia-lyase